MQKQELVNAKFLFQLKKTPHISLLTNIIIRTGDFAKPYLTLNLTCQITRMPVWMPLRNKDCRSINCLFNFSEEFANWALKSDTLKCPSCQITLQRENFAVCSQTESILSVVFSQKSNDIKSTVFLDIQELVKDSYRSPDKYIIFDERFFLMTPITGRSRASSRESNFFKEELNILQESLSSRSQKLEQIPPEEKKSNSRIKKPTISLRDEGISPASSTTRNEIVSPGRSNKWKQRISEVSPENRMNKWHTRDRSESPAKRINKWENKKLKDLNLTKLITASATCRANYLSIMARDTFNNYCKVKTIHYFQEKTKFLHLLDLVELFEVSETSQLKLTRVELNISNNIPDSHNSLVDGYGEIYMIGGYDSMKNYKETKDILVYDELNKTMVPKGTLLVGRSGHACCVIRENIYIIGGYCDDKTLKSCERFNCLTGKSEQIADMNTETAFSCVVAYNNKCVFKFGGRITLGKMDEGIERYDIQKNIWESLYLSPSLKKIYKGMCLSAGVQANPSEIFVFGGCYDYFGEKSSTSYIFNIQNDDEGPCKITGVEKISIPIAERFDCNNQVIVHENHLFCLQNLQKTKKDIRQGEFAKRILMCDGSSWILVN